MFEPSVDNSGFSLHELNKQMGNRPSYSSSPPSGFVPQIDGVDHAPAMHTLPAPTFLVPRATKKPRNTFFGLFSRKENR